MLVTTLLMALVIVFVWQMDLLYAFMFLLLFGSLEALYLSSAILKFAHGGWAPFALSSIFMFVMYVWQYGTRRKYLFDLQNKVSMKWILTLGPSLGVIRVPGIGLIYTELVTGVPAIFSHFITNLPAFHQILVFVCVKSMPVPFVPPEERYLIGRIGTRDYRMYRCIVRYGYKDVPRDDFDFENHLVMSIAEFIQLEAEEASSGVEGRMAIVKTPERFSTPLVVMKDTDDNESEGGGSVQIPSSKSETLQNLQALYEQEQDSPPASEGLSHRRRVRFELTDSLSRGQMDPEVEEELDCLVSARRAGVAYVMGHSYIKARKNSSFVKRFAIDVAYSFLRKNCRGPSVALSIPHISLIEVGMIYYV